MKKKPSIHIAFFTLVALVFGNLCIAKAQPPNHDRKSDSLQAVYLLNRMPDSLKKKIAKGFKDVSSKIARENSQEAQKSKIAFEHDISKALNLKLVVRDTDYKFSRLHIFGDTLFGDYQNFIKKIEYREYFIQSLTDTSHLNEFNNSEFSYYSSPLFSAYRNGCVFFGGGSTMKTLCSDGKITEFFSKYRDSLNDTRRVYLYKDQAILIRTKDISGFSLGRQLQLWKLLVPEDGILFSCIKGDTLFFSSYLKNFATVTAYNIKTQSTVWKSVLKGYPPPFIRNYRDSEGILFQDNNTIILPTDKVCYTLNMSTGALTGQVIWKDFFDKMGKYSYFKVANNEIFINDYSTNNEILKCIDIATNKTKWEFAGAYFVCLYKENIIAFTTDKKYYLVIDKLTGVIKNKIPSPSDSNFAFDLIGNYILINLVSIYK